MKLTMALADIEKVFFMVQHLFMIFFFKRSPAREMTQWGKALTVPAQGSEFNPQS